jgi:soluble lytic murein transglycosylase
MPRAAELERVLPPAPAPRLDPCAREDSIELLRPFVILKALALEDLGAQHLRLLLAERPHEPAALLALARYEKAQRRTDRALMLARRAFPDFAELEFSALPREVWETLYPRDFHHLIEQQAHAHGLEVPLVLGLIRQESAFNPRATSVADARGLMQILPSTAARSRQQRRAVARRLYQPAYNLRVGCGFLRGLLNKFDGIPERALAAYHAGSSRVSEWLAKQTFQDAAEFLESIPIASTRVYVEAVLRDAEIYRQLRAGAASFKKCE